MKVKNNDSNQEDESTYDDDDLINFFEKFLRKERFFFQKETPIRRVTCFECGKRGHVKSEYPTLENKDKFKGKKIMQARH